MSRQLLDALRRIRIHGPQVNGGICANAQHFLPVEGQLGFMEELSRLIHQWPAHSGSRNYPVRAGYIREFFHGSKAAAQIAFQNAHDHDKLWDDSEYANRRRLLLDWLIFSLEMEIPHDIC